MIYPKNYIENFNFNFNNFQKILTFSKDLIQIINSVEVVLNELQKFKSLTDIVQPLCARIVEKSLTDEGAKKLIIRFNN